MTIEDRARLWGGATIAGALAACLVYALDRTRAALDDAGLDPLTIVAEARIGYFWRIGLSAFVASLIVVGWITLFRGQPTRAFAWIVSSIIPVLVLCTTLSVIWP